MAECTKFFWRRGKEDGRCQKGKAEIQSFQVQWDWLRFLPATGRKERRVFKRWIRERIQRIFFTARKRGNLKKSMWKTHSFPHSPQTFPQPVIHNPCGKRIDVDIKYLQFDTEFFTFPENGQFAPVNRFVENYPLDKKRERSSAAGKDRKKPRGFSPENLRGLMKQRGTALRTKLLKTAFAQG